jgi:hypothetical protein
MIPAVVKALQDEVSALLAKVDELQAKCERQEALLRDIDDRGSLGYEPSDEDLRVRIAAALKETKP